MNKNDILYDKKNYEVVVHNLSKYCIETLVKKYRNRELTFDIVVNAILVKYNVEENINETQLKLLKKLFNDKSIKGNELYETTKIIISKLR